MAERRETAVAHRHLKRRRVLQGCCGLALCAPVAARGDETDEALAAPQTDDALAFAYGDRAGQVIAPADVVLGAKQLLAYPLHPATGRDGLIAYVPVDALPGGMHTLRLMPPPRDPTSPRRNEPLQPYEIVFWK